MKKLFFVLALAFGLMSFVSSNELENNSNSENFTSVEFTQTGDCDYYVRKCRLFGEDIYCTEWECVIVLDEIVIQAPS